MGREIVRQVWGAERENELMGFTCIGHHSLLFLAAHAAEQTAAE